MSKKGNLLNILLMSVVFVSCAPKESTQTSGVIPGQYIVVLKKPSAQSGGSALRATSVHNLIRNLAKRYQVKATKQVFSHVLSGAVYQMDEEQALELADDPEVAYVEPDYIVSINSIQSNAPWGLDRLDQGSLPLNSQYVYTNSGANVNVYVIDTGIKTTHQDFAGRAVHGADLVDGDSDATDCNGHGTHVAGTIGGSTYGVAKGVKLHAVRVLDCGGFGQFSNVIAGIEWVTAYHIKPAVVNMSLGGPVSQAVDDAVLASIQAGVTYVVASGNSNTSACSSSPAHIAQTISVGSSTRTDARSDFSNYGECVDVFAPGTDILSTWSTSNTATNTISGTSMASPHVAGVAALYLSSHPNASPAEVATALVSNSLSGKLSNVGSGSPNKLINAQFVGGGDNSGGGDDGGDGDNDGDDNDDSEEDNRLVNGVVVANISLAKNGEKFFVVDVPQGSTNLVVEIFGGSGDADLYLRQGSQPTVSSYECRPYLNGNAEKCTIAAPKAGTYHILLRAYSAFSGVSIKASYQKAGSGGGNAPCSDCLAESGQLASRGSSAVHPNANGSYQAVAGSHQVWLSGPSSADFDLYLLKRQGSSWVEVAKSLGYTSAEKIVYQGSVGEYRVKVVSYSGSGKYDLWLKVP